MKKTPKKKTPSLDEISEMAAEGKDVSNNFTQKFRVRQPLEKAQIQRVNVDFNLDNVMIIKRQVGMIFTTRLRTAKDGNRHF